MQSESYRNEGTDADGEADRFVDQISENGVCVCVLQNDRKKAQSAMEATWKGMEKKEKIPWIKKAAEDQKRYEVQYRTVVSDQTF